MNPARFARLVEQEAIDGDAAYTATEFLAAMRKGIWKELDGPQIKIDAYRRNLQHVYLDAVNNKVNGNALSLPAGLPVDFPVSLFASSADEKPAVPRRTALAERIDPGALARTTARETKAHLQAARDQIARILDPKFAAGSGTSTGGLFRVGMDGIDLISAAPDDRQRAGRNYVILPN